MDGSIYVIMDGLDFSIGCISKKEKINCIVYSLSNCIQPSKHSGYFYSFI